MSRLGRVVIISAVSLALSVLSAPGQGHEHHASGRDRDEDGPFERRDRDPGRDSNWERNRHRDRNFGSSRERSGDERRPPGWSRGRKRGWGDCDVPPGQAKKQGCHDDDSFIVPQHQTFPPKGDRRITRREVARFDGFLDSHPAVARTLQRNPSLINNQAFLARNPSLRMWLKAHPEAADKLRKNPSAFTNREPSL